MTPLVPPSQRRAEGKALREHLPREAQAEWRPAADRPDIVALLQAAVAHRHADLLPLRWARMAQSPFYFYRGNAALMALDLKPWPVAGLEAQLCGDAHLLNFGAYAKPDGSLVFDLNDFDETCRGPFEWDLKRFAASLVLAGREAGHGEGSCRDAVGAAVQAYREALDRFADMKVLELAREELGPHNDGDHLEPIFEKARRDTPERLMAKGVEAVGDGFRFQTKGPFLRPLTEAEATPFQAAFPDYRGSLGPARQQVLDAYAPVCFGRRVSGCGSLGVTDVLALCFGNGRSDPLFLEFKAQHGSVWRPSPAGTHEGRRAAEGQHRLQTWADPFLGWCRAGDRDFLVKQWSDHKASLDVEDLAGGALAHYGGLCATVLAKAHARSGDPAAMAGYGGEGAELDDAMAAFARTYADQATADWEAFRAAAAAGRVPLAEVYE
ncbi:MAG: DUF2252 domain-containing protein [Holophagaceae bacterium]